MTALDNALKKVAQLYEDMDNVERWYQRQMRTYPNRRAAYEQQLQKYLERKSKREMRRQRNTAKQEARRKADKEWRQRVTKGLREAQSRRKTREADPVYAAQLARSYQVAGTPQSKRPRWLHHAAATPAFQQASQAISGFRRAGGGVYAQSVTSPRHRQFQRQLGRVAELPAYQARAAQTAAQYRAPTPGAGSGFFSSVGEGLGKAWEGIKGVGQTIGGLFGGAKTAQSADLMSPMFGRYRMNFNRPFRFRSRRPLMTFGNGGRFVPGSGEQRFGGPFVPGSGEQRFGGKFKPGSGETWFSGRFKPGSGVMFGKGKHRPRGL